MLPKTRPSAREMQLFFHDGNVTGAIVAARFLLLSSLIHHVCVSPNGIGFVPAASSLWLAH